LRVVFPAVITESQASELAADVGYLEFSDPRVSGLVEIISEIAPVSLDAPAYCRVEQRPEGHAWHQDTGTKSHMGWCKYSAGLLLVPSDKFSGGGFYFRDNPDNPVFHYCDLLVWSGGSDNVHSVARNSGERVSLIMFFGGSEDG
tara:strand:+ start:7288 stop:7722 length:435 start_codon:yes stop_codon:yes gene_type:complete